MKEHSYEQPEAPYFETDLLGTIRSVKVNGLEMCGSNRNKPCPCGSGKKRKKCCRDKMTSTVVSPKKTKRDSSRYDDVSAANYPKGITSSKEDPRSKCNVTACQSTHDVNYKNNWNQNKWYCYSCFVDHTESDLQFCDGYRYEQAEPHPLLTPYKMLNHAGERLHNKFVRQIGPDPINGDYRSEYHKIDEAYTWFWIKDNGDLIPVPYGDVKRYLIVFENDIFDGTAKLLVDPLTHYGIKEVPLTVTDGYDYNPVSEKIDKEDKDLVDVTEMVDPISEVSVEVVIKFPDELSTLRQRHLKRADFVRLSDGKQFEQSIQNIYTGKRKEET